MQELAGVRLERSKPLRDQIRDQMRDLIRAGTLKPGVRIPATQKLAELFDAHVPTVHQALRGLVQEGLLVRQHKLGTFVRERESRLTAVALYYYGDVLGQAGSLYTQAVHAALRRELARLRIAMDVWVDPRPSEATREPWPEFVKAAQQRRFQAVILTVANPALLEWMAKLPVPVAVQTAGNLPNRVAQDMSQFVDVALRALVGQGCRSVGLITPLAPDAHREKNFVACGGFFARFTDLSGDLGLTVRNSWMRAFLPGTGGLGDRTQEAFGYEQFHALWRQGRRPEGLVVFPDTVARGVIMAVREQQVRVPAELKLVLAKNETIDLLCPVPATWAVHSEQAVAKALLAQVQKQFRGDRCEPIFVPFRLMAHPAAKRIRGRVHAASNRQPTNKQHQKGSSS